MIDKRSTITKTVYKEAMENCEHFFWTRMNRQSEIPEEGGQSEWNFQEGREVEDLARSLFRDGITITLEEGVEGAVDKTLEQLDKRRTLFGPCFSADRLVARVDILRPNGADGWDLIEVKKATTSSKDIEKYYIDIAFQLYVCRKNRMDIRRAILMVINADYVRGAELEPEKLFVEVDVTDKLEKILETFPPNVDKLERIWAADDAPAPRIGKNCVSPYPCAMKSKCWSVLPRYHVLQLWYDWKICVRLFGEGITELAKVPDGEKLKPVQRAQVEAARSGRAVYDLDLIREFRDTLTWPLYFLDFETFGRAIPILPGTRPYENIPFQYEIFVQDKPDGEPRRFCYLHETSDDPRPEILRRLRAELGDVGSIVAYNKSFEKKCLYILAGEDEDALEWANGCSERLADLMVPFQNGAYYHPDQMGSTSLKAVMPVLTGTGYGGLEIGEGTKAMREYYRVTYQSPDAPDRADVYRHLKVYCEQDTRGMINVLNALRNLT